MPKVMIEMKMPISCIECKLCSSIENSDCYMCQPTRTLLGDVALNKYAFRRHKNCPLQEVKE